MIDRCSSEICIDIVEENGEKGLIEYIGEGYGDGGGWAKLR